MTFTYSMGPALIGPPTMYDVLSCLRSDAWLAESGDLATFEDYCSSLGGNPDSIRERDEYLRTRAAVENQTADLRFVLQDSYIEFLDDEDAS